MFVVKSFEIQINSLGSGSMNRLTNNQNNLSKHQYIIK